MRPKADLHEATLRIRFGTYCSLNKKLWTRPGALAHFTRHTGSLPNRALELALFLSRNLG